MESLLIGLVSISDRASSGVYEDKGIPGLNDWFTAALRSPWRMESRLIPDEQPQIERTLVELVDTVGCHLVLTTGGTGPAPRDVTPEATLAVAHKVLPGFGEQMRQVSLKYVPTAILSRQVGVIRGRALILNLPGQPKAIKETLDGIFPAVPYCIDLIGGPYIETNEDVCKAFRPKSALRTEPPPRSAAILDRRSRVAGQCLTGRTRRNCFGPYSAIISLPAIASSTMPPPANVAAAGRSPTPSQAQIGPSTDFEQREERDLGRRQVTARDHQHHAGDGELEHPERREPREIVRARLERERERQRDERRERAAEEDGGRQVDRSSPISATSRR